MTWTPFPSAASDGMNWSVKSVGFTGARFHVAPRSEDRATNTWLRPWTSVSNATYTVPEGPTPRLGNSWTRARRPDPKPSTLPQMKLEVPTGTGSPAFRIGEKLCPPSSERATQIVRPGKSKRRSLNGLENRSHATYTAPVCGSTETLDPWTKANSLLSTLSGCSTTMVGWVKLFPPSRETVSSILVPKTQCPPPHSKKKSVHDT